MRDAHRIRKSRGKTVRIDLDVNMARGEGFLDNVIGGIKKVAKSVVKPVVKTLANTAIDKVLGEGIIVPEGNHSRSGLRKRT